MCSHRSSIEADVAGVREVCEERWKAVELRGVCSAVSGYIGYVRLFVFVVDTVVIEIIMSLILDLLGGSYVEHVLK